MHLLQINNKKLNKKCEQNMHPPKENKKKVFHPLLQLVKSNPLKLKKLDSNILTQSINMVTLEENQTTLETLKQFEPKQKQSNIKTFIRVRPLNKMELEFNENGTGSQNINFPDNKSVQIMPEKSLYTLDKVYTPETPQSIIYEEVGREMIKDVLQGYNGTIFAYGATGSGKTHTMFGDIQNPENRGIIPRVSSQIFEYINTQEQDIEFLITCSMLEIYKEQLFDLLNVKRVGLKIKEMSQKGGIFVQGLTNISVESEEDILDSINLGYQSKQTRETCMNEYSSRSHTIFTINVTQRLSNGQVKTGKLNLVDLAGSEKLAKTQATGESLEEAKKINLSLSCLGNVIHSLTTFQEHIPYRDSKLTRILQESLGGNFKTSLIATISPHSSSHEEQISTLKFATRAKTIKNRVKMNVTLSHEQMKKLIEQLKNELEKSQSQNAKYKQIIQKLKERNIKTIEDLIHIAENVEKQVDKIDEKDVNENILLNLNNRQNNNSDNEDSDCEQYHNNNSNINDQIISIQNKQKNTNNKNDNVKNIDYKQYYHEKVMQCRNQERELMEKKKELLESESKLAQVKEEKNQLEFKFTKQITKNDYNKFEIEILQKQVQSLIDSICKQENTIGTLMKDKQQLCKKQTNKQNIFIYKKPKKIEQSKIDDYLTQKLNFTEIHFSEYFKNSINFNYDNLVQKWSEVQKNIRTIEVQFQDIPNLKTLSENQKTFDQAQEMIRGSFIGNLDFNTLNKTSEMLEEIVEFPGQLEKLNQKHPISRDVMIILLKKQIFKRRIEEVELETQFVKEKLNTCYSEKNPTKSKIIKVSDTLTNLLMRPSSEDSIQKNMLPLTYDRAMEELKNRNQLIKKIYQELNNNYYNGVNQEFIEQIIKEKERLETKIVSLQNELKMQMSKSEHYFDAYKAEKQNFILQKEQSKALEQFLVNKMKEESEAIEKTYKKFYKII
ncbi:kinesin motor domain protein [Ichthyophthirius multifiliis]|uniref:Kinesin-like protein n=1 Tax=Ichthyophthirius multifiliis TaxID=5932 RepID=G0QWP7_ICHMU|nr:kinesin motor domain protein [Ichthyophthirius multifiliis]EGR30362.1 kinesin motor domain protein [Ichthyophthirius multifiliis]|eukprot:XP_004031949.1 kinesin motor domain protein [Ichthyophthirius multifiliis]